MRINPGLKITNPNTPAGEGPTAPAGEGMTDAERRELEDLIADMRRIAGLPRGATVAEVKNSFLIFAMFRGFLLELNATAVHGNVVAIDQKFVEGSANLSIEVVKHDNEYHVQLVGEKGAALDSISRPGDL